jgi:3-oxoacyl-[acyl-carrier protein] reductase
MDLKLKGKTALVTGGSEGIGKGIARALAQEGVDVRSAPAARSRSRRRRPRSPRRPSARSFPITADLSKDADSQEFVEQGHKALGRVDIMVNNAGSSPAA